MTIRTVLRDCIQTQSTTEFDDTTDLFATGILSSLQVMDVLLIIEAHCGRRLEISDIRREHLSSIDAMLAHFCPNEEP